jgi:NAD(P)-dependent dehydrogenase (short-subunit alcohol dehydrogenase family)
MKSVEYDFRGSTALVTGATKGIGREIAVRLAAAGCSIGLTGRNRQELAELQAELSDSGVGVETMPCDLADPAQIPEMVAALADALGGFDFLVNNAGLTHVESVLDTSVEHWDEIMAVNLRAPLLVAQSVIPTMVQRGGGSVVNVGSLAGEVALEDHAAYCASKWGLHGLTKVMALELGQKGIRVNAVAPTVVMTPMGQEVWGEPEKGDPMKARIPMGRFVEPGEVVDTILYLLSDSAAMINGTVVVIDGGYSVW